jgi:uncharacterized protein involved in outer membrane biogenesis
MTTTRTQKWVVGILSIITLLTVAVYLFEWNMLRGFVERRVMDSTGRSFQINGDLDVDLSWRPRITLNNISLGNAAWSDTPRMASLQKAEIVIDLRKLFRRDVSILRCI